MLPLAINTDRVNGSQPHTFSDRGFFNLGTYFNPSPPCLDGTLKHSYALLNVVMLAPQAGADVWITNGGQRTASELVRLEISEVEAYVDELTAMIRQEVCLPLPVSRFPRFRTRHPTFSSRAPRAEWRSFFLRRARAHSVLCYVLDTILLLREMFLLSNSMKNKRSLLKMFWQNQGRQVVFRRRFDARHAGSFNMLTSYQ